MIYYAINLNYETAKLSLDGDSAAHATEIKGGAEGNIPRPPRPVG